MLIGASNSEWRVLVELVKAHRVSAVKSLGWVSRTALPLPNGGREELFEDPVCGDAYRVAVS